MKVLTFSSLYPNAEQPRHGIFVEERVRHLRHAYPDLETLVLAPVPWFPLKGARFGEYAKLARVPAEERRHGTRILHPRYPVIPKVGMNLAPILMASAMLPKVRAILQAGFRFDLIDAHFLYPDGVAAVYIAKKLNVPVLITARGNDISLYPRWRVPRAYLRWAIRNATAVAGVCEALVDAIRELEPSQKNVHVLRNGVDLEKFKPLQRDNLRQEFGLSGFVVISVGHTIERKGHHLIIEALPRLQDVTLMIAGDGPMDVELRDLAVRLGVADRVRFLGAVSHADLVRYYNAADALVLASSREGWANVLLEAMACGTPVVATAIWGTPEVVQSPEAGVLISERTPAAIAEGVMSLKDHSPDRMLTRAYAERFSWDETSAEQWRIFKNLIDQN